MAVANQAARVYKNDVTEVWAYAKLRLSPPYKAA